MCISQVRELVEWNYQSLSFHAEELLSQDEVDRAMAIYLGIILVWRLEPYVTQARNWLKEIKRELSVEKNENPGLVSFNSEQHDG